MSRLSAAEIRERGLKVEDVRAGEARMQDYHRAVWRKVAHDFGAHRGLMYGDCTHCLEALTEACHRLSDWMFVTEEVPSGFRRG